MVHRENRIRAKLRLKSWEEVYIKILQNTTVRGRSLSGRVGNESTVPKGVTWTCSQGLEMWRANKRRSVQLTQISAECLMTVKRAVPWS